MKDDKNNEKLDRLISQTIGREKPKFDFNEWKESHQSEIQIYESQEKSERTTLATFEPNILRIILWRKAGYIAAAFFVICSLVACFVLSRKVTELKRELEKRDVAIARIDESSTINLYLREHQDVVARHVSLPSAPQPAQMRVSQDDILYYEFLDNGPEFMRPGIIVRGPSSQRQISSPEAPVISNGHTMTLSEARKTTDFELQAPSRLHPGYSLEQIRRIEDSDTLQLLYTDGINSVSLFEQPLDGQRGLEPQDFREYAVYRNKEQAGGTILAWRDNTLSYVLISNIEMSQLMDMAQSISVGK
jgi:hypothetical protein